MSRPLTPAVTWAAISGHAPACRLAGFSLHADTGVAAGDRRRLENLLRYVARPALAADRLSRLPDGRLVYRLKRAWRDGTTAVALEPIDLLGRLAALVPAPRAHLVHYYGVFAPAAVGRSAIVAGAQRPSETIEDEGPPQDSPQQDAGFHPTEKTERPRNDSRSRLMRRVFELDVLACPACGGRLRIIAAIMDAETAAKILACLDLPSRAPPVHPARQYRVENANAEL